MEINFATAVFPGTPLFSLDDDSKSLLGKCLEITIFKHLFKNRLPCMFFRLLFRQLNLRILDMFFWGLVWFYILRDSGRHTFTGWTLNPSASTSLALSEPAVDRLVGQWAMMDRCTTARKIDFWTENKKTVVGTCGNCGKCGAKFFGHEKLGEDSTIYISMNCWWRNKMKVKMWYKQTFTIGLRVIQVHT